MERLTISKSVMSVQICLSGKGCTPFGRGSVTHRKYGKGWGDTLKWSTGGTLGSRSDVDSLSANGQTAAGSVTGSGILQRMSDTEVNYKCLVSHTCHSGQTLILSSRFYTLTVKTVQCIWNQPWQAFILTALLEHVAFCFLATQSCQFKSTQGARAFLKEDFADSQPALYHYNVGSICKWTMFKVPRSSAS